MLSLVGLCRSLANARLDMLLSVEIVYATEDRQELVAIQVTQGTTVAAAIESSSIASLFPDERLDVGPVGIWGRLVERSRVLQEGDRIELYRQLQQDPRDARRARADAGQR